MEFALRFYFFMTEQRVISGASLPSRGRGSKPRRPKSIRNWTTGRSLHGGADRNVIAEDDALTRAGRSLHGGADRNMSSSLPASNPVRSLPSRGRGSKPSGAARPKELPVVA